MSSTSGTLADPRPSKKGYPTFDRSMFRDEATCIIEQKPSFLTLNFFSEASISAVGSFLCMSLKMVDRSFIIIPRGDRPTGGYSIQINFFSWLESYPVIFRFSVNFTDPGEGVAVTEALTNPLAIVSIGKLSPGEYEVEVQIDPYIMTLDENGNPVYTRVKTFSAEIWKETFTIE